MSTQKRRLPFVQMDVFTREPLTGNQLAVFLDGSSLSDAEMQLIAREKNLSETTFILPGEAAAERKNGVRVRIFTTTEELPFAGHPTLGTAMVLYNQAAQSSGNTAQVGEEEIALALKVGRIPVKFSTREGLAFGMMTQRDPEFAEKHTREDVARATGLTVDDIADDLPIQTVTTGNAFAIVPVKSLAVLRNLAPSWANMKPFLEKTTARFFYFVSRETQNPEARLQARMIFYNGEDPATGSAAGPCIAWAVKYGVVPADEQVLLEQGVEIQRTGKMFFSASNDNGKIVNVRVGGHAVEVIRGELFL